MFIHKCIGCNNNFEHAHSKKKKKKYCSRSCYLLNPPEIQKKKLRSNCLHCFKECKRSTTKFCSKTCDNQYRTLHQIARGGPSKKLLDKECPICKKIFSPQSKRIKYCSRHCMGLNRREEFIKMISLPREPISQETRRKMSILASERNANRVYTKGIGGTRNDIGHYVRSTWEANFARYLIYTNQKYKFEPNIFVLKNENKEIRYTPDFKVEDKYFEIKGWWNEKSLKIKKLMQDQYPDIKIEYIDEIVYKQLEKQFGDKINGWEFKSRRINEHAE